MSFDARGVIRFVNRFHVRQFGRDRVDQSYFIGRRITELPGLAGAGLAPEIEKILQGRSVNLTGVYFPEFVGGHSGYVNLRGRAHGRRVPSDRRHSDQRGRHLDQGTGEPKEPA